MAQNVALTKEVTPIWRIFLDYDAFCLKLSMLGVTFMQVRDAWCRYGLS
jgi:hypothetical protein